jgi:hypothetical protein
MRNDDLKKLEGYCNDQINRRTTFLQKYAIDIETVKFAQGQIAGYELVKAWIDNMQKEKIR